MPNVTFETHSSSSSRSSSSRRRSSSSSRMENTMEKITCRQGNTMPLKDGEAPKLHPENA